MIYDTLSQLALYRGLHVNLDRAIEHCLQTDFHQQQEGKYEVDGDKVFYFIQNNQLNTAPSDELEVHENYLDLHFLLEGHERIGYGKEIVAVRRPFDKAGDIGFVSCQQIHSLEIDQRTFVIFFPKEPHQPNQYADKEPLVRKCVFKVLID